jgi:hypothetical protein
MVPIGGVDKLKGLLQSSLSYGDCKDAIAKVIEKIADITGSQASHTDVMELFNMMTSQTGGGGIYMDFQYPEMNEHIPEAARLSRIAGGSGLSWTFGSSNGPQRITAIFLKGAYSNSSKLAFDRLPYDYVITAIHELIHDAPKAYALYDHPEMDKAAKALGVDGGIDNYIKRHCTPPGSVARII